jgi:hypothetical protein
MARPSIPDGEVTGTGSGGEGHLEQLFSGEVRQHLQVLGSIELVEHCFVLLDVV